MASKTSKTPASEMRHQVHIQNHDSTDVLREFGQCASTLRDLLYDDRSLDEEEFAFMDNHFQVLQMAYLRWKRRHRPTDGLQV